MLTPKEQARVKEIMKLLDCTEDEAIDVIETDKIIDKGGRTQYDLPIEKEKEIKKLYAVKDRMAKDKEHNQRGKTRAENVTKANIIAELADFLTENGKENVNITNKERQISFTVANDTFELTLVQKRKPKVSK